MSDGRRRDSMPTLRELPLAYRAGVTLIVVTILAGFIVSGVFLRWEYENRDERPGLTLDDIRGAYHGVTSVSPILSSLRGGHPDSLADEDRQVLVAWLEGGRVAEDYDNLDLGDLAPAEIIGVSCMDCHARGSSEGAGVALEYWDDIEPLAFSRRVEPKDLRVVAASTHAHAPSMALILLVLGVLAFMTRFGRGATGCIFALAALGLLADMAGQWGARIHPAFVLAIVGGGFVYGIGVSLLALVSIGECWLPRRAG